MSFSGISICFQSLRIIDTIEINLINIVLILPAILMHMAYIYLHDVFFLFVNFIGLTI